MIRGKLIGEGAYGKIYNVSSNEEKVIKCVLKRNLVEEDVDFAGNIRELDLLLKLKHHPNIVQIQHVICGKAFQDPKVNFHNITNRKSPMKFGYKDDILHFALERADMDLYQYIYKPPKKDIDGSKLKDHRCYYQHMMIDMLFSIQYMHKKQIHHRDIKPSNFLLFSNKSTYVVKTCDFGLSKIYTQQGHQTPNMCTTWYRAPEIVMGKEYNEQIDVWALGCVFYEMWIRKPFVRCGNTRKEILELILKRLPKRLPPKITKSLKENYNIKLPRGKRKVFYNELFPTKESIEIFESVIGGSSKSFSQMIEKMLSFDPKDRISIEKILQSPFFKKQKDRIQKHHQDYIETLPSSIYDDVIINIIDTDKRKWIVNTAFYFYNEHIQGYLDGWYEHRILFQAIDLYDRYLEYEDKIREHQKVSSLHEINKSHSLDTQIQTEIQFLVCVYISIKYFATLYTPVSYKEISQELFEIEGTQEYAKAFEPQLLEKVYQYNIYRPTLYEYADNNKTILTSSQIRKLLIGYGTSKPCKNKPLSTLYKEIMSN